jgi:antitoxin component of RelBE/YafQ-DinJ toxin-antitoxin module
MAERTRAQTIHVRVTEDEGRKAKALAEHHGLSLSDVIRQFIRQAYDATFPPKKSAKAPR